MSTSKSDSIIVLPQTPQLVGLYTIIRDQKTSRSDFIFYSDRIIRLVIEAALDQLPVSPLAVTTPTGTTYDGVSFEGHLCGVSIVRAGESMEAALRGVCRSVRIGKILIQRDEATALPHLLYSKLPADIHERYVLLLDPMLATGGSACMAVRVLKEKGVPLERILFVNLLASPEGIANFQKECPGVKIVCGAVDEGLDENKFIKPGLGDFGDRYYCI